MRFPKKKWSASDSAPVQSEKKLQKQCEDFLRINQIKFIRIPDELWRFIAQRAPIQTKKILSCALKGVPDITILFKNGSYLCVELKSKSGIQSTGQKQFEKAVTDKNYTIIKNFDDFVALVSSKM